MKTERMAFGFVLVASMVSTPLIPTCFHCAFVILTTSGAGGVPGVTVTVNVAGLADPGAAVGSRPGPRPRAGAVRGPDDGRGRRGDRLQRRAGRRTRVDRHVRRP